MFTPKGYMTTLPRRTHLCHRARDDEHGFGVPADAFLEQVCQSRVTVGNVGPRRLSERVDAVAQR